MAKIELHGYVNASMEARTVGDLRALVRQLDTWGTPDARGIDWGSGLVFVDLADSNLGDSVEEIDCGDHVPTDHAGERFWLPSDFIIQGHECSRVVLRD